MPVPAASLKHLSDPGRPRRIQPSLLGHAPIDSGSVKSVDLAAGSGVQVIVTFGVSAAYEGKEEGREKRGGWREDSILDGVLQDKLGNCFYPGILLPFHLLLQRLNAAPGQIPNDREHAHPQPGHQAVELLNHFFPRELIPNTTLGSWRKSPTVKRATFFLTSL
ncbi:unnamed protein product [Trypanosoma congolense IL3000]|uniref:WGS project CAEQ00000000 data, annotated contig 1272 n=1 Tax=Trypanosoma congolense (strain IL3000) TaxID=1068625 RepID=F9W538_TRYCI|nr:unnamed protein product [Trypanosoma congolense IL3000]